MTDMIISFIVQHKFDEFINLFHKIFKEEDSEDNNELKNKGLKEFTEGLSGEKFITLYNQTNEEINKFLHESSSLDNDNVVVQEKYFESKLLSDICRLQNIFKTVLIKFCYTYTITVKNKKDNKEENKKYRANAYTYFLQRIGNNIRNNGDAFENDFTGMHMFALADRANHFIKAIRKNNKGKEDTLICLDAIRNPYEATFFQDRYSAFYLISIKLFIVIFLLK